MRPRDRRSTLTHKLASPHIAPTHDPQHNRPQPTRRSYNRQGTGHRLYDRPASFALPFPSLTHPCSYCLC